MPERQQLTPLGLYAEDQSGRKLRCTLCPHNCLIRPDTRGFCGVRENVDGQLHLPFYAAASAVAVDPIEKKPLYHFLPGSQVLSIGFLGCSLRCPFCQNYRISQSTTGHTEPVMPDALVARALEYGVPAVAYTYNEPTIHLEYVLEASRLAHTAGLKNVLVTAGYLNETPARELFQVIDAANIDLKSFNEKFYRQELRAGLPEVRRTIEIAASLTHVEITTLLIPGKNDSDEEMDAISRFIADINPDIPLHLSAYYPTYKYTAVATPPQRLRSRMDIARRYLHYVYPGNVRLDADTSCPGCGTTVVRRTGFRSEVVGLTAETPPACTTCGHTIPVVR